MEIHELLDTLPGAPWHVVAVGLCLWLNPMTVPGQEGTLYGMTLVIIALYKVYDNVL